MVVGDMSLTSACCIVAHNDYKVEKFAFDKNNEFWWHFKQYFLISKRKL
jgi:hypothetical protein